MDDELKEKAKSAAKTYFGTDNIDVYCIPEHDAFLDAYEIGHAAALSDDGWKLRCEELEVVAAALYLGHDDAKEQFSIYREVYLADQGNVWKPTEEEPFPY